MKKLAGRVSVFCFCLMVSSFAYGWTCQELSQRNPQTPLRCGGAVWLGGRIAGQPQFLRSNFGSARSQNYQSRSAGVQRQSSLIGLIVGYVLISGFLCLVIIRPPLIGWYRSQRWFILGTGPIDILFRQIGFRFGVEFFIFCMACLIGSLGGNLVAIFKLFKAYLARVPASK